MLGKLSGIIYCKMNKISDCNDSCRTELLNGISDFFKKEKEIKFDSSLHLPSSMNQNNNPWKRKY